jgi:predicted DNA-binding transcriptional regulator AlpA
MSVPNDLIPDPEVLDEFHISAMTLWRWDHDEELKFPPPIRIRNRKYRQRSALDEFKQRLIQDAIHQHQVAASQG